MQVYGFHGHPAKHKAKGKDKVTEEELIVGYGEFVFAGIMALVGLYRAWVLAHKTDDFEEAHKHLLEHSSSEEEPLSGSEEGSLEEPSDDGDESGKMPPTLPVVPDEEKEEEEEEED